MTKNLRTLAALTTAVTQLQADMSWVKKLIWVTTSASLTAGIGVLTQLIKALYAVK